MRAAAVVAWFWLSALSACVPNNIATQYARYSGCPEEKVEVDDNAPDGYPRASGCGNSLSFRCNKDGACKSPVIVVANRHAKQFSCTPLEAQVESLGDDAYIARGCGQTMTYQCFYGLGETMRCIVETTEHANASE